MWDPICDKAQWDGYTVTTDVVLGLDSPVRRMPEYHVGWPTSDEEKLDRIRHGLPVYCPEDPKVIEQREYIRFAEKRPPNSK